MPEEDAAEITRKFKEEVARPWLVDVDGWSRLKAAARSFFFRTSDARFTHSIDAPKKEGQNTGQR